MKLLLACSLIAIALVPLASAGGAGAGAFSYGYGDCKGTTYAYNYNQVYAGASTGGVYAYGEAQTFCGVYQDWFTGATHHSSGISGSAYACGPVAGCTFDYAAWYSYDSYCNAGAFTSAGYVPIGCPAGGPPAVPALLP